MNYYIDMQQLEIVEKNTYTAIEVGTLIPLQGDIVFEKFFAANSWTGEFIPNKNMRISSAKNVKTSLFKAAFEFLLNARIIDSIDNMLMKITAGRWQRKTLNKKLNSHGVVMGMVTGKHFAKPDPINFQSKLLERYDNKVLKLLREYENNSLAH
jgi:hypothetical protein